VIEKPAEIVDLIRTWRGSIVGRALADTVAAEEGELAQVVHLAGSRPEPGDD
jgi:hypothetical protein